MARYKSVDPDSVLDAAEEIVRRDGIDALTIDAVAKAAGISKGGVQSSFGTKNQLICAMFRRCVVAFEASVAALAGDAPAPMPWLRAYVQATRQIDTVDGDRAASMMAALLDSPDGKSSCQEWYRRQLDKFDLATLEGRRARLAFLANEGIFMLRFFGFMKVGNEEWEGIFDDLAALIQPPSR